MRISLFVLYTVTYVGFMWLNSIYTDCIIRLVMFSLKKSCPIWDSFYVNEYNILSNWNLVIYFKELPKLKLALNYFFSFIAELLIIYIFYLEASNT